MALPPQRYDPPLPQTPMVDEGGNVTQPWLMYFIAAQRFWTAALVSLGITPANAGNPPAVAGGFAAETAARQAADATLEAQITAEAAARASADAIETAARQAESFEARAGIATASALPAVLVESGAAAKISRLPAAASVDGTELYPISMSGTTQAVSGNALTYMILGYNFAHSPFDAVGSGYSAQPVAIQGGSGNVDLPTGADATFGAGNGYSGVGTGGNLRLSAGTGATPGNVIITGLPTADPVEADAVWADSGVLVLSGSALPAPIWNAGTVSAIGNGLAINSGTLEAALPAPPTKTGTSYTVIAADSSLIINASGTFTLTLPAAASYSGRRLYLKSIAAQLLISASSDVSPIASATPGTAIFAATAGKWCTLQSDGSNWITMAAG